MKALIYTISLPLAALLGFGVHRANLCTVKTVAEIFSTRKTYLLKAMLKTVLWVIAISMPILLFLPDLAAPNRSYAVTIAATVGGFMFGVGATINGACAFSTIGYLANGNFWMLTTLIGYCLGVAGLSLILPLIEPGQTLSPFILKTPKSLILSILAALWLFLCWEIFRLWKSREKGRSLSQLFLSRYYRLSTAALVLGFSGGVLYALFDTWTYTNALKQKVQLMWMPVEKPDSINQSAFISRAVLRNVFICMAARQLEIAVASHKNMASPSYRRSLDGRGSSANSRGQ
jgi:hypothetical protein